VGEAIDNVRDPPSGLEKYLGQKRVKCKTSKKRTWKDQIPRETSKERGKGKKGGTNAEADRGNTSWAPKTKGRMKKVNMSS